MVGVSCSHRHGTAFACRRAGSLIPQDPTAEGQGVLLCGVVPAPRALRESRIINTCLTADCFKPRSGLTGLEGAIPYRLEQEEKGWSAGTKYCGTQNTSMDQRSFAGVLGHIGSQS